MDKHNKRSTAALRRTTLLTTSLALLLLAGAPAGPQAAPTESVIVQAASADRAAFSARSTVVSPSAAM